jgi:hypothetical protein
VVLTKEDKWGYDDSKIFDVNQDPVVFSRYKILQSKNTISFSTNHLICDAFAARGLIFSDQVLGF